MQYLQQNSQQTLREGLEEYSNNYPFLNKNDGSDPVSLFYRNHDITHVLYGTIPFQLRGETINDVWTLFGSDVTIKGYMKFFDFADYKTVTKGYKKHYKYSVIMYLAIISCLPIAILAIIRALKMRQKWPWYDYDAYLDKPLQALRKEFNIRLIKP